MANHYVIFVGGPSGCGKSTTGSELAKRLHCKFIEGDQYHPKSNVDKMAHGKPLNDADRAGWLQTLGEMARDYVQEADVVVSCSMLKKKYRDSLRATIGDHAKGVVMLVLYDDYDEVYRRMEQRQGHFMKAQMLKSQFDDLELPEDDELNTFVVRCNGEMPEQVADKALAVYHRAKACGDPSIVA